jgi:hypothetical protein
MSIRTLSTREVYRNPWLRLREDQIERSNGARGIYGVVEKDDCAVILPIEGDTIYLHRAVPVHHPAARAGAAAGRVGDGRCRCGGAGAGRVA